MARDQVFISYCRADREWLERLQTMLAPLQRQGTLDVWADTCIQPGQLWKDEIQKALARAKVAVLLVSPDFLASEFIHKDELPPLLEASRKEGLTILWVPVRPSLYSETVIAHYQAAHEPRAPLSTLPQAQQETALVVIAKKLMAIRPISSPTSAQPSAPVPSSATIPIPEQVTQTPSPPPTSPTSSSVSPPQPLTTWHDWKPLLIGVVLGILGGTGEYHVGHKWLEQTSIQTSSLATNSVQPLSSTTVPDTAKTIPAVTVIPPPQQSAEAKSLSLPPVQNIHDWSAPQVQELQTQTAQALKTKVEFRDNLKDGGQGPLMVVIPAGRFQMRSPDNEPGREKDERQHEVEINAFAISKYEITFEDYDRFADATKREKPDDSGWGRGRRPVIGVTWNDAIAYTDWLSKQTGQTYRLPTEAEWEYAARAGTTTPFYFGETIGTG